MKKLKLMPSILMLVACVAVLGVGVFAVAPTKNTISGSITINSANPEVLISAYGHKADGSLDESNVIMEETPARSGVNINLGNLNFDTSSANDEEDLAKLDIKVTIRISNPSSTKLGVYFSKSPVADKATTDDIAEEKELTDSTTAKDNVKAVMEGYKALNAKATDNGVCDTTITFKLLKFVTADQNPTINLSDNANKLYLNIEEYQQSLDANAVTVVGTSGQELTSATVLNASNNDKTSLTKVKIADGVTTIGENAFNGCTNLESIDIPESVIFVNAGAFLNCSKLNYTTENNVKYLGVGDNPYYIMLEILDCYSHSVNSNTKIIAGKAYNKVLEEINELYNGNGLDLIDNITIPEGIISISEACVSINDSIYVKEYNLYFVIPSTVQYIGGPIAKDCASDISGYYNPDEDCKVVYRVVGKSSAPSEWATDWNCLGESTYLDLNLDEQVTRDIYGKIEWNYEG